jgi:8-oxo-dGTP pyrophosphatase MutT (NUDIX family)
MNDESFGIIPISSDLQVLTPCATFLARSDERGEAKLQAKRSNDESIAEGAMDEEEMRFGKAAAVRGGQKSRTWRVLLIQHKHGRHWGFPKGHAELGESPQSAAARELKEETNLEIVRYIHQEPLVEQYRFFHEGRAISKRVFYFVAEVAGSLKIQSQELEDAIWVPIDQAFERLTHQEAKNILKHVAKILKVH